MSRFLLTFDNFGGGEYGLHGGLHAPPNSFTGTNVVVLPDGSICPRSGLIDLAPTGAPVGVVKGFGLNAFIGNAWFITGTGVYDFGVGVNTAQAVRAYTGALTATPTVRVAKGGDSGRYTHVANWSDKSYVLDVTGGSVAALTGSPDGVTATVYGDRLVVAGSQANAARVKFSAAGDYNSWPAANYFDVGYPGSQIVHTGVTHNRLAIAQTEGKWWLLSGVPGFNDVLREQTRGAPIYNNTEASTAADGTIWFHPGDFHYPMAFTGSALKSYPHLDFIGGEPGNNFSELSTGVPKIGVSGLMDGSDVAYCVGAATTGYANQAFLNRGGTWTKHSFAKDISGYCDGRFDIFKRVLFCDGGAVGVAPKFYAWRYDLNRPPMTGTHAGVDIFWESIGDASSTVPVAASFTLPEWWAASSRHRGKWDRVDTKVVAVIVDFKKWNHGWSAINNGFTVNLTPMRIDGDASGAGGDGTAVTGSWSEAPSAASSTGTLDRQKFTFDPQFGNGFRLGCSSIVGVAIQKIQVEIEFLPGEGV